MNKKTIFLIVIAVIILIIIGVWLFQASYPATNPPLSSREIDPDTLPGIQTGPVPWAVEQDHLQDRLTSIGLPALKQEGSALHTHQHLDLYIKGQSIAIPADIGIGPLERFIAPIHTHDNTKIIHVESPKIQKFTLGQFFDTWGVRLTDTCLGAYCNDSENTLQLFVNGKEVTQNFRDLALAARQEIVITFGTPQELPNPIPASYTFPAGY